MRWLPLSTRTVRFIAGASSVIAVSLAVALIFLHMNPAALPKTIGLYQRSALLYGVVRSIDPATRAIEAEFTDQFVASGDTTPIRFFVVENTLIIQQTLLADSGAYVSLSEETRTDLSAIVPGSRIAVNLTRNLVDNTMLATLIIFGNPL